MQFVSIYGEINENSTKIQPMVCYVVAELEKNELFGRSHNCTCKKN